MTVQEFYAGIGGSYETAKSILMRDSFIERIILKFPEDRDTKRLIGALREAGEKGDAHAAFDAAHGLKSVTGNCGFAELYGAVCALVEQLRPAHNDPGLSLEVDRALLRRVDEEYTKVTAAIAAYAAAKAE